MYVHSIESIVAERFRLELESKLQTKSKSQTISDVESKQPQHDPEPPCVEDSETYKYILRMFEMQEVLAVKHAELKEKQRRMEGEEKRAVQETGRTDRVRFAPRCEVVRTNGKDGPSGSLWE
jgi:hypothetical protein